VLEGKSAVRLSDTVHTVEAAAMMNYWPGNMDDRLEAIVHGYLQSVQGEPRRYLQLVRLALAMGHLQIPQDYLLRHIFRVPFIAAYDKACRDVPPEVCSKAYKALMELNRLVVLEAPGLDIPWFHDRLPRTNGYSGVYAQWQDQTHQALVSCLGGDHVVKSGPLLSSYHHPINFEVSLDEHNNPIPVSEVGKHPQAERVAVLIMGAGKYFINERSLVGPVETSIRQLEIMGYRVVKIPYYELSSMYMSGEESWQRHLFSAIVGHRNQ